MKAKVTTQKKKLSLEKFQIAKIKNPSKIFGKGGDGWPIGPSKLYNL